MKKLMMLLCMFSLSIYAESFIKPSSKSGRHRQANKLSQEEQIRVLSKLVKEIAELGEILLKKQQTLMGQIEGIVEYGESLYTKDTIKTLEDEIHMLKLCQQKIIQSLPSTIVT